MLLGRRACSLGAERHADNSLPAAAKRVCRRARPFPITSTLRTDISVVVPGTALSRDTDLDYWCADHLAIHRTCRTLAPLTVRSAAGSAVGTSDFTRLSPQMFTLRRSHLGSVARGTRPGTLQLLLLELGTWLARTASHGRNRTSRPALTADLPPGRATTRPAHIRISRTWSWRLRLARVWDRQPHGRR